jgi:hypothetical protein
MGNEKKKADKKPGMRTLEIVPVEILRQYPGKCIVYSEDEKRVIGVGDTWDQASDQAHTSGVDGMWHYAYSDRPDELIF